MNEKDIRLALLEIHKRLVTLEVGKAQTLGEFCYRAKFPRDNWETNPYKADWENAAKAVAEEIIQRHIVKSPWVMDEREIIAAIRGEFK